MTTTLGLSDDDLSDTFCDQNDELLFSRISDDLSKHGYSVNVNALPLALAEQLSQHISAISDDSFKQASIGRNKGRSNNKGKEYYESWNLSFINNSFS